MRISVKINIAKIYKIMAIILKIMAKIYFNAYVISLPKYNIPQAAGRDNEGGTRETAAIQSGKGNQKRQIST